MQLGRMGNPLDGVSPFCFLRTLNIANILLIGLAHLILLLLWYTGLVSASFLLFGVAHQQ